MVNFGSDLILIYRFYGVRGQFLNWVPFLFTKRYKFILIIKLLIVLKRLVLKTGQDRCLNRFGIKLWLVWCDMWRIHTVLVCLIPERAISCLLFLWNIKGSTRYHTTLILRRINLLLLTHLLVIPFHRLDLSIQFTEVFFIFYPLTHSLFFQVRQILLDSLNILAKLFHFLDIILCLLHIYCHFRNCCALISDNWLYLVYIFLHFIQIQIIRRNLLLGMEWWSQNLVCLFERLLRTGLNICIIRLGIIRRG